MLVATQDYVYADTRKAQEREEKNIDCHEKGQ
jgi:hypothetical protein